MLKFGSTVISMDIKRSLIWYAYLGVDGEKVEIEQWKLYKKEIISKNCCR